MTVEPDTGLRQRAATGMGPANDGGVRLSKKKRRAQAKKLAAQNVNRPETSPKSVTAKQALKGAAVFAVAAAAGGAAFAGMKSRHVAKTQGGLDAMKQPDVHDLKPQEALKPETPPLTSRERQAVELSLEGRRAFDKNVKNQFGSRAAIREAPQGECIDALVSRNPHSKDWAAGDREEHNKFFDKFDEKRRHVEKRAAIELPRNFPQFELTPPAMRADRMANVRLLDEQERAACVVSVDRKGAMVDVNGKKLSEGKHIAVIDTQGNLYTSPVHGYAVVHHSSFVGGEPVIYAGELDIDSNAKIVGINPKSGHYLPNQEKAIASAASVLGAMGADLRRATVGAAT